MGNRGTKKRTSSSSFTGRSSSNPSSSNVTNKKFKKMPGLETQSFHSKNKSSKASGGNMLFNKTNKKQNPIKNKGNLRRKNQDEDDIDDIDNGLLIDSTVVDDKDDEEIHSSDFDSDINRNTDSDHHHDHMESDNDMLEELGESFSSSKHPPLPPLQKQKNKRKQEDMDEEITSEEEEEDMDEYDDTNGKPKDSHSLSSPSSPVEDDTELADEKRIRLAKAYLNELKLKKEQRESEGFDAAEIDRDLIADRLREDALESRGVLYRPIASYYQPSTTTSAQPTIESKQFPKAHSRPITSVAVCTLNRWIYTGCKNGLIVQWNMDTCKKHRVLPLKASPSSTPTTSKPQGHTKAVTSLAVSGPHLISGSEDTTVKVWDQTTGHLVHTFKGHRAGVTSVAVSEQEPVVYSGSMDKTVKSWHLHTLSYIETLFGHEEGVQCVVQGHPTTHASQPSAAAPAPACFSVGGRDGTVRGWQVQAQSHLVFRHPVSRNWVGGSVDTVCSIDSSWFVSGNDGGVLAVWHRSKKNPVAMVKAHDGWIIKVASVPFSDIVVSGGLDGAVHVWRLVASGSGGAGGAHRKPFFAGALKWNGLEKLMSLPFVGCINDIAIVPPAPSTALASSATAPLQLYIAVAHEHKAGRWWCIKEAPSGLHKVLIFPTAQSAQEEITKEVLEKSEE